MTSSRVRKARTAWRLGFALVLAGFVLVLFVAGQSLLMGLGAWLLLRLPGMLALPALGFALMTLGASIAKRQLAALDEAKRETQDRQRRVRQYGDGERLEPFIGTAIPVPPDFGPR